MSRIGIGSLWEQVLLYAATQVRHDYISLAEVPFVRIPTPYAVISVMPPSRISYVVEQGNYRGVEGRAEFLLQVLYRFDGSLEYHELPHKHVQNVMNNVLIRAVALPSRIHRAVRDVTTPDRGTDIVVSRSEQRNEPEGESDWLYLLNINMYITFAARIDDTGDVQPEVPDDVMTLEGIRTCVYRDRAGTDHQEGRLDYTFAVGTVDEIPPCADER